MNLDQIEAQRKPLTGHCYRMLGSTMDADDAVQETMIRAWKSFHQFDGRSSLRTWLYRIATNVCLDEIANRGRRSRPMAEGPPAASGSPSPDQLIQRPRTHWIEPIADDYAIATDADPSERAIMRQSIRLAFVAALQHLAPKQRAVLVLMEVLEWSAAEVAETLQTSVAAVNSALQRARGSLTSRTESNAELSATATRIAGSICGGFRTLRRGRTGLAAAEGCCVLYAALRTLASGSGGRSDLDVGNGFRVPGIEAGCHRGVRFAGVCTVPAKSGGRAQGVGSHRARAFRRADRGGQ